MIISTTGTLEGFKIIEYLSLVTADYDVRHKMTKDMATSLLEGVGKRSDSHVTSFDVCCTKAFKLLEQKAESLEANAIVGVTLQVIALANGKEKLIASGTAVRVRGNTAQNKHLFDEPAIQTPVVKETSSKSEGLTPVATTAAPEKALAEAAIKDEELMAKASLASAFCFTSPKEETSS